MWHYSSGVSSFSSTHLTFTLTSIYPKGLIKSKTSNISPSSVVTVASPYKPLNLIVQPLVVTEKSTSCPEKYSSKTNKSKLSSSVLIVPVSLS